MQSITATHHDTNLLKGTPEEEDGIFHLAKRIVQGTCIRGLHKSPMRQSCLPQEKLCSMRNQGLISRIALEFPSTRSNNNASVFTVPLSKRSSLTQLIP